ncbi:hypothetical protein HK100_010277 [Physocladia obscura]|uniref:Uncharacterized protein n=1 Tax=Physocladia obscura TaxID=109957 RepID=A0AAD5T3T7_9FUNG|nr:hypothetical protein HK100_010277 [Physocladia obscura]
MLRSNYSGLGGKQTYNMPEVPLRVAIKHSQRNSDIFAPPAEGPRTVHGTGGGKRFDRNASTVFGAAWNDQPSSLRRERDNVPSRMASDIFNTNNPSSNITVSNNSNDYSSNNNEIVNNNGEISAPANNINNNYQPSLLEETPLTRRYSPKNCDQDYLDHDEPSLSPEEEDAFKFYQLQKQQLRLEEEQQQQYQQQHREQQHHQQLQQQQQNSLPPRDYSSPRSATFNNIFSDSPPASYHPTTHKRNNHHKHTNIFNDHDSSQSPLTSRASSVTLPFFPPHSASGGGGGINIDQLNGSAANIDLPRSGRRHFNVPSKSAIFDYPSVEQSRADSGNSYKGSLSVTTTRRDSNRSAEDQLGYESNNNSGGGGGSGIGAVPTGERYISRHGSETIVTAAAGIGSDRLSTGVGESNEFRSGGLSSSDLNRERFGRGRRLAFEQSQIFF